MIKISVDGEIVRVIPAPYGGHWYVLPDIVRLLKQPLQEMSPKNLIKFFGEDGFALYMVDAAEATIVYETRLFSWLEGLGEEAERLIKDLQRNLLHAKVITYKGVEVVTTKVISRMFGVNESCIKQNHSNNPQRFKEGRHFFMVIGEDLRRFKAEYKDRLEISGRTNALKLWTPLSLGVFSKMLSSETAWKVTEAISDYTKIVDALNGLEVPDDLPDMYVYAIRESNTGNIKIGISKNPEQRLKQLQVGNSSPLELVTYRKALNRFVDESTLHAKAEEHKLLGEWFSEEALSYL